MTDRSEKNELIDTTQSPCPSCLKLVDAKIIEKQGSIFLSKHCPDHGSYDVLLSEHPDYYRGLRKAYYSILSESLPQNNYYLQLHFRCNMHCPICLDNSGENDSQDFDMVSFKERFRNVRDQRICILGGEPTEFSQLPDVIRFLSERNNRTSIASNGINLVDPNFLSKLKEAGLNELRFQFDGFKEETNKVLRGRQMTEIRLKAVENVEKIDMNLNLIAVIKPGLNEDEIGPLLKFAVEHDKIKELFLLGIRSLGRGNFLDDKESLVVDQMIDMAQEQTKGRIKREDIFNMQRLFYLFYSIFKIRQCFYNQFLVLIRDGKGDFWTFNEIIDMPGLQKRLDTTYRLCRKGYRILAGIHLLGSIARSALNLRAVKVGIDFFRVFLMAVTGWNAGKIPRKMLILGFVSACDRYIFDTKVQHNCAIGSYSADPRYDGTENSSAAYALRQEQITGDQTKI